MDHLVGRCNVLCKSLDLSNGGGEQILLLCYFRGGRCNEFFLLGFNAMYHFGLVPSPAPCKSFSAQPARIPSTAPKRMPFDTVTAGGQETGSVARRTANHTCFFGKFSCVHVVLFLTGP